MLFFILEHSGKRLEKKDLNTSHVILYLFHRIEMPISYAHLNTSHVILYHDREPKGVYPCVI